MFSDLPWDLILEILGFVVGILYLWWEYHADSRLWFASIVMPTISMWIYLRKGIYADFAINIYYFVIAIYGYIIWTHSRNRKSDDSKQKKELPITHISSGKLRVCLLLFFVLWIGLYCILRYVTDSNVPLADGFTTALSIVAMWLLAQKYIEQWLAWIAVDAVCVGLYFYKEIYPYAVLYLVYTIIAFIGYRNWKQKMLNDV